MGLLLHATFLMGVSAFGDESSMFYLATDHIAATPFLFLSAIFLHGVVFSARAAFWLVVIGATATWTVIGALVGYQVDYFRRVRRLEVGISPASPAAAWALIIAVSYGMGALSGSVLARAGWKNPAMEHRRLLMAGTFLVSFALLAAIYRIAALKGKRSP